jgi:hypothetical protein
LPAEKQRDQPLSHQPKLNGTRKAVPGAAIEACSLITKEEVGAVQNTTITDTNRSETSDGAHLISQCYYGSAEPDKSGSLGLMQRNPKDPGTRTIQAVLARNV